MIPKIIHYCWFGGSEIPDEYKGYIAEWRELHPDWQILRWDESNSPIDVPYMQNALKLDNWANCSNFMRLWILKKIGGIYLDADFKLLKPLDSLLANESFFGFEEGNESSETFWVNNAICGAKKGHDFFKSCFEELITQFDGTEQANLSSPHLTTNQLIKRRGLMKYGTQKLSDVTLFSKEVFYPIPWDLAKNVSSYEKHIAEDTIAVHMWGRTWFKKEMMLNMIDDLQLLVYEQKKHIAVLEKELDIIKAKENTRLK